jgi:two-component system OmpR family response regulator
MRIAFAEDDEQLRTSVARGLREAGSTVALAERGDEALALVREGGFDVVVLDLLLPGMSGIEVCRTLRAEGNGVPILMLTALDAVEDRIAGLDAGADDYLTKPFAFGEMLARLRALTRRHSDVAATRLAVGALVIDTARHRVQLGAATITLTAREFDFLVHLARNAGRVVSRADLMALVWQDARGPYSNIIDVYASRLRRKLESVPGGPVLMTVRGAGFLLDTADGASDLVGADGTRDDR